MSTSKSNITSSTLWAIFLIFFIGNFGIGLVFPLFSGLILNPNFGKALLINTYDCRPIYLGLLLFSFPVAQFCSIKVFVTWAKRHSLKSIFAMSLACIGFGFLLCAFAIEELSLIILLIARAWTGFFSGSLFLCLFLFGSITQNEEKCVLFYRKLSGIASYAFLFGVLSGGLFSDTLLFPEATDATPFWLAAFFTASILIFVLYGFENGKEDLEMIQGANLYPWHFFKDKSYKHLHLLFSAFFFYLLAWLGILLFFSYYYHIVFHTSTTHISLALSGMTICYIYGYFKVSESLQHYLNSRWYFVFSFTGLLVATTVLYFSRDVTLVTIIHIIMAGYSGLVWSGINRLFSINEYHIHPKLIGIKTNLVVLAAMVSAIVGASLALKNINNVYIYIFICFSIGLILTACINRKQSFN